MTRVFLEDDTVRVPAWVVDLESFRRWSDDDDFPETGQISFLHGEVWIDMSKEQLFTHNQVKHEISFVLTGLIRSRRQDRYFPDGVFLSNIEADISNQPDGIFVSADTLREGGVRIVVGRTDGHVELEGSPDTVLEVVSRSSVEKDTEVLRRAYATAGVREYWLVDARDEVLKFDIFRPSRSGSCAVRKRNGWARSDVFGQWFRLSRHLGEDELPVFTLEAQGKSPV